MSCIRCARPVEDGLAGEIAGVQLRLCSACLSAAGIAVKDTVTGAARAAMEQKAPGLLETASRAFRAAQAAQVAWED